MKYFLFNSLSPNQRRLHTLPLLLLITIYGNMGCKKDFTEKQAVPAALQSLDAKKAPAPNIILFIADDFGYELPTFTGGSSYNTPNLDYLAANGMAFTNAYSHPDGFPSRLALYTGKYSFRNYTIWGQLPTNEKTVANMLHDVGYATCFVGKWQCDGGDARIHSAGYDKYRAFIPFALGETEQYKYQYKNPKIYENGNYLPDSATLGKFSEDMYTDYLKSFIDTAVSKGRPFFAVYAHNLPRSPWAPVPDDPDYAGWIPDTVTSEYGNKKYYPGMIQYMDKKIGEVIQKLKSKGLQGNTIILFVGDNATNKQITSTFDGKPFKGGKNYTTRKGIRTPLVACWPLMVAPGVKNDVLVDYTDFLPTIADIVGMPRPSTFGTLDGVSFYDNLTNTTGTDRTWSFCHWDNSPNDSKQPIRYVFDANYKLYDTAYGGKGTFYNVKNDATELHPLADSALTPAEILIKDNFKTVLSQMHN